MGCRPRWRRGGWGKRRHESRGWGRHHREGGGWGRHHRGERMRHGRWYDDDDRRGGDRDDAGKSESDKE